MKGKDLNFQVLQPKGVSDADLDCSCMSLTVAQNDGLIGPSMLYCPYAPSVVHPDHSTT